MVGFRVLWLEGFDGVLEQTLDRFSHIAVTVVRFENQIRCLLADHNVLRIDELYLCDGHIATVERRRVAGIGATGLRLMLDGQIERDANREALDLSAVRIVEAVVEVFTDDELEWSRPCGRDSRNGGRHFVRDLNWDVRCGSRTRRRHDRRSQPECLRVRLLKSVKLKVDMVFSLG